MSARLLFLLWAVSLATVAAAAALFRQPGYFDAYYYYHVAANLAAGRGLVEDLVWSYLSPPEAVSHPSNLYWMPLTSLVAGASMAVFGPGFRAAQAPLALVASLAPVAAAWAVWDLWRDRGLALAAAALTLFGGFYFLYWTAVDGFGLFAVSTTIGLWAGARLLAQDRSQSEGASGRAVDAPRGRVAPWGLGLMAGVAAGAAHLTRADGFLTVLAVLAATVVARSRGWRAFGLAAAAGYLLLLGPWAWRVWALTGSPLPPGTAATLFFREYNDLFGYGQAHTLGTYLSWGAGPILLSKLAALGENLVVLYGAGFMLAPLGLLGIWRCRRDARLWPFLWYTCLLYLTLTFLFTFPGARGSMRHSGVALLPWTGVVAALGLQVAVAATARRLPGWDVRRAWRGFILVAVGASLALALAFLLYNASAWDREYQAYQELARRLNERGVGAAPVMVTDPPAYHYVSGRSAVATPSNGVQALLAAADRYGVAYVALEPAHAPALRALYVGDERSPRLEHVEWIGPTRLFRVLP
ncbi:MAG: hypothetical protein HYY02_02940 [Chloroflexi bacterium]|nr:hypothetical protein [Chloroflexota bacterium]